MIETITADLIAPPEIAQEVRKRGKRTRSRQRRQTEAIIVTGTVIIEDDHGNRFKCLMAWNATTQLWECLEFEAIP